MSKLEEHIRCLIFVPGTSSSRVGSHENPCFPTAWCLFFACLHLVVQLLSGHITGFQSVASLLSSVCFPGALHLLYDCVRLICVPLWILQWTFLGCSGSSFPRISSSGPVHAGCLPFALGSQFIGLIWLLQCAPLPLLVAIRMLAGCFLLAGRLTARSSSRLFPPAAVLLAGCHSLADPRLSASIAGRLLSGCFLGSAFKLCLRCKFGDPQLTTRGFFTCGLCAIVF